MVYENQKTLILLYSRLKFLLWYLLNVWAKIIDGLIKEVKLLKERIKGKLKEFKISKD